MNIVLGPFHPHLEDALAGEIRAEREKDLLTPILVVVPSDALRRRIKILLTREHGLHLLNFRVHTFFQLTSILFQEAHGPFHLPSRNDTFMEEALRRIVDTRTPLFSFAPMIDNDGTCATLWQSLRDLKDGLVDPEVALEALNDGQFEPSDEHGLRELFTLYREIRAHFAEWGALDYGDLDVRVEPCVEASNFLGQFSRIYYYGFYDLTQTQLELFQSVARNYSTTLFFPLLTGHPAWSFAENFYQHHLQGLVGGDSIVDLARGNHAHRTAPGQGIFTDSHAATRGESPHCTIISCSGTRDEVLFTAKKILELVETDGLGFEQIGVAARTLDAHLPWVEEIFPEHGIPFNTPARAPLLLFNLVKALLLLVNLPVQGFLRARVIDLLASPYFKVPQTCANGIEPRPDLWDILTRSLRISRGLPEWTRLEQYLETGLTLRITNDEDGKPLVIQPTQVAMLLTTVRSLDEQLSTLPERGTWSDFSNHWRGIIHQFIDLERGAGETPQAVTQAIEAIFAGLCTLEAVSPQTSLSHFTQSLHKELARGSIPVSEAVVPGVNVLDAMAARGTPFRALFLMGLNEGVFPRGIHEDPFLRDRARRVLDTVLGFKISEKRGAYEEEQLLFSLLVGSASDRLFCIYQRSDSGGRALAPSWYLDEIQRNVRTTQPNSTTLAIPRGMLGKGRVPPFDAIGRLLPDELVIQRTLRSMDPSPLIALTGAVPETYRRGVEMIRSLEDDDSFPGPLDGLTGPLPEAWDHVARRGISPTNLEAYGRCPFQYFARHVLRVERLERPEDITTLEPVEMGKICHDILHQFYEKAGSNLFLMSSDDSNALFDHVSAQVMTTYEVECSTGYPVEWAVLKEWLINMLRDVIRKDLDELRESNFHPMALEMNLTTRLGKEWPDDFEGLPIHGRLDRIDVNTRDQRLRVVDYKFKLSRAPLSNDKNLVLAAAHGRQLQPPIYTLLAMDYAGTESAGPKGAIEAAFYYLAPNWEEGPLVTRLFSSRVWLERAGASIRDTITQIIGGIHQGEFFILPGSYCGFCDVSEICRKAHLPSLARAERYSEAVAMERMRRLNV